MKSKLTIRYDHEADILILETCTPYSAQESDELSEGVVARSDPSTGWIEGLELLFFVARIDQDGSVDVPIAAEFRHTS